MSRHTDRVNMRPLYFSTRRSARVLGCGLVLAAALAWLAAGYDLGELRALSATSEGAVSASIAKIARAEAGRRIAIAQAAGAVLVAAMFVPWLHQARENLRALAVRRLRFGREWTYLSFAVPLLNAYRPCQVVYEVWRGSDPASTDPLGWQRLPVPPLVLLWWVGLVGWVAGEAVALLLNAAAPGHVEVTDALALAGDICAALSASLGYFVVMRISAAQDAKWLALGVGDAALRHPETARSCPSAFGASA
jgi:hypothetical protein